MRHERHEDRISAVTIGLLAGAAVGAGLALAFAPQRGSDTRRQIRQYGRQTVDAVNGAGAKLRARGRELAARGRDVAVRAVDRGSQAAARTADHLEQVAHDMETSSRVMPGPGAH